MPPVINSHELGKIDETTRDVFLEVTGPDLALLEKAIAIIATALADMGGTIESIECIQQNRARITAPSLAPKKRKLSLEHANALLGLHLKERELKKILPGMGYDYRKGAVLIPAWRTDLLHEVDLIEDIAIAYGYERLLPELPPLATMGEESQEHKLRVLITEALVSLGLIEISTYHLTTQEEASLFPEAERIELENSKTEYKALRRELLTPALRTLAENKDNAYPQKLFEIGRVFKRDRQAEETGIAEPLHLALLLTPANFTDMKQHLDALFSALSLNYTLKETARKRCIDGRTASIALNNEELGFFGELHPETLRSYGLRLPAAVLEISLEPLLKKRE